MKLEYVLGAIAAVLIVAFGFFFFDVDQTEEARLPDVDVAVEGGNMPEFDVEAGDVEVGSEEVTLNVPTVDVQSPEEENGETTN